MKQIVLKQRKRPADANWKQNYLKQIKVWIMQTPSWPNYKPSKKTKPPAISND